MPTTCGRVYLRRVVEHTYDRKVIEMVMITLRLSDEQDKTLTSAMKAVGAKSPNELIHRWISNYKDRMISTGRVIRSPTPTEVSRERRRLREKYTREPSVEELVFHLNKNDLGITATEKHVETVLKRLDSYARYNEKRKPSKES